MWQGLDYVLAVAGSRKIKVSTHVALSFIHICEAVGDTKRVCHRPLFSHLTVEDVM